VGEVKEIIDGNRVTWVKGSIILSFEEGDLTEVEKTAILKILNGEF
jgi:hypothetical protein